MDTLKDGTVQQQLQEIEHIKKARVLAEKLKNIPIAMLATSAEHKFHSRPMYTFELKDDGIIWFLLSREAAQTYVNSNEGNVLLNYSNPQTDLYISVYGKAEVSEDSSKIEELWDDKFKAWFPAGKTDANICLLKIDPQEAEYWDSPDLLITEIISLVKNTISGNPYTEIENKKITF